MMKDQSQIVNEHMQQNASADSTEEVRRRKRMAELKAERERNKMERGQALQGMSSPSSANK